jgi:predicted HTH transcriptional regulator
MALLHIPLNQLSEQHILELIAARAPETNIIEYKRDTYGNALRDDLEFLADVSSLANTSGSDLIIGIAATQGVPEELVPFTGDFDAEINRLDGPYSRQIKRNAFF